MVINNIESAKNNFLEAITRSEFVRYANNNPYAEQEQAHAEDVSLTVQRLWELKYSKECPKALIIAGLYHDFDRVFLKEHSNDPDIKTDRRTVDTTSIKSAEYTVSHVKKVLHPANCAAIFEDYNPKLVEELKSDISYLIKRHEIGGDRDEEDILVDVMDSHTNSYDLGAAAEVLCEADGLSFFNVIIYSYINGRPMEKVKQKIKFSYEKLSKEGKQLVREAEYRTIEVKGVSIDVGELVLFEIMN